MAIDKARLRELQVLQTKLACGEHPELTLFIAQRSGGPVLVCTECDAPPAVTVERPSPTQRYRRGEAIPAAMRPHIERRLGVTEQSKALVQMAQAAPPSRLPTPEETTEIVAGFAGWTAPNSVIPPSTAVALWGLVNMGILPVHINLLGGKPYITEDGMLAHASRLIRQEGRQWGRVVYAEATAAERSLAGCKADHEYCTKATYQERSPVKITYPDGRIEEKTAWFDVQSEWGRASSADTVVKVGGKEQPVEKLFPGEMARARATRRVLRLVAPVRLPEGVGYMIEGHAVEVLEQAPAAIEAPAEKVLTATEIVEGAEAAVDDPMIDTAVYPDDDVDFITVESSDDEPAAQGRSPDDTPPDMDPDMQPGFTVMDDKIPVDAGESGPDEQPATPEPLPRDELTPRVSKDITAGLRTKVVNAFKAANISQEDMGNLSFQSKGGAFTGNGAIVAMLVAGWSIRDTVEYALRQLGRGSVPPGVMPGRPYDEKGELPW